MKSVTTTQTHHTCTIDPRRRTKIARGTKKTTTRRNGTTRIDSSGFSGCLCPRLRAGSHPRPRTSYRLEQWPGIPLVFNGSTCVAELCHSEVKQEDVDNCDQGAGSVRLCMPPARQAIPPRLFTPRSRASHAGRMPAPQKRSPHMVFLQHRLHPPHGLPVYVLVLRGRVLAHAGA